MMYSVVDAIVRPLPFTDPGSLVAVHESNPSNGVEFGDISYQNFVDYRAASRAFSDLAAYTGRSLTFADGTEPERLSGQTITWKLFPMLGVQPILGRHFTDADDRPGAPGVVLLSHGLWQRRYAADPQVVGRVVTINGAPTTIVGVMPPRFEFPERIDAWIPLTPIEHANPRGARSLAAIGIACGAVGAFGVTRVVNSVLYNVSATDPLSFIATAAFLAAVAVLASYVPARRATAVDPMIALRTE
jgi:putative ABC transport system permease protein